VDLIRNVRNPQKASKMLVDHALARFSSDNLSCMVVRLDASGKFDYSEAVTPIQEEPKKPEQTEKKSEQPDNQQSAQTTEQKEAPKQQEAAAEKQEKQEEKKEETKPSEAENKK
jgi:protein phosphatase PTC1